MFRKIVSNLPFSSSLVEQLSAYAKKLRTEQISRKIGLIFLFLTILVQILISIQPPESANASESVVNISSQSDSLEAKGLTLHIEATNITQGFQSANNVVAEPNEQISFTLHINNQSKKSVSTNISINLTDVLEYAELIDDGGGVLNKKSVIVWPQTTLEPNSQQTRTFIVKMLGDIPATPTGTYNPSSYDCRMKLIFGDEINIKVNCPAPKIIENIILALPNINQSSSIIISCIVFFVILFFYIRNKQMQKEIQIIRKDINSGAV